jgi:hypothetical protein
MTGVKPTYTQNLRQEIHKIVSFNIGVICGQYTHIPRIYFESYRPLITRSINNEAGLDSQLCKYLPQIEANKSLPP